MRYNGHRNRHAWNVALWIGNDEGLYNLARDCWRAARLDAGGRATAAARRMLESLAECGITSTPDGSPYRLTYVRSAIAGLEL